MIDFGAFVVALAVGIVVTASYYIVALVMEWVNP